MNRILRGYVEARRRAEPTSDAIDFLIAEGKTTDAIVKVSLNRLKAFDLSPDSVSLVYRYGHFCRYGEYRCPL